jgi:hypothetical protein
MIFDVVTLESMKEAREVCQQVVGDDYEALSSHVQALCEFAESLLSARAAKLRERQDPPLDLIRIVMSSSVHRGDGRDQLLVILAGGLDWIEARQRAGAIEIPAGGDPMWTGKGI